MRKSFYRKLIASMFLPFTGPYNVWRTGIRILMYHRINNSNNFDQLSVSPARFKEHMAFLSKNCRVISLQQAIKELSGSTSLKPGVVVTFDDGYRDNLEYAFPILKRYNIPATIFITTQFCDQTDKHPRYKDLTVRLHLTWREVLLLCESPLISIGSHTLSHPYLSRLSSEYSCKEIADSKQIIQSKLGVVTEFFCYPSGDYHAREVKFISQAGYNAAVTVAPGINSLSTSKFELRRTEVTDKDDVNDLWLKLFGAYDPLHTILHLKRKRAFNAYRASDTVYTELGSGSNKSDYIKS